MKIKLKANAKINLFLDILGRLPSGYHSLFMIMQSVSLGDEIILEKRESEIVLSCSEKSLPTGNGNIAYRAAEAFFEATGLRGAGVDIEIQKHIPFEAGLAGGSADAAAVIVGLNQIYKTGLSAEELCGIGIKIGSDVPFCIRGGTMLAQHTGGVLSPLPPLKSCGVVLAKPATGVSTARAYSDFDSAGYIYRPNRVNMLSAAAQGDFENICRYAGNVFEQTIEVAERVPIKHIMREHGCVLTQMSGSGPTVFGLFEDEFNAAECRDVLDKSGLVASASLCRPAVSGVEITA